jgi:hypothetical protein
VLLDLADRADLREVAGQRGDRIGIASVAIANRPADAMLIRPDALIAWAATIKEPSHTAAPALRNALSTWFGDPPNQSRV